MHKRQGSGGRSRWKSRLMWLAVAVVFTCPLVIRQLPAAIYMQLDGIPGEVDEGDSKAHQDWIEVLSFTWGTPESPITGGDPSVPPVFQNPVFHKKVDKASPQLLEKLVSGKHIPAGKIHFTDTIGGAEQVVLSFDLEDIIVTSYTTGGDAAAADIIDSFGLEFDHFEESVFTFSDDGQQSGDYTVFWTVTTNSGGSSGTTTNTAPTISAIGSQSTGEDLPLMVSFTIGDNETPAGALTLSRGTSNPLLVPLSNIVFGGSGTDRTVTITPAPDQSGTATITINVSDGELDADESFPLTVNAVNDGPSITPIVGQVTDAGVPLDLDVVLDDVDSDVNLVTLAGSSNDQALLPDANITFSGAGATRVATLIPVPGLSGDVQVTLVATDGEGEDSAPMQFLLTVNPGGGDAPTDIVLSDDTVPENSPGGTVIGTLTATDPNPGDSHTFALTDDAGGLFVIAGVDSNELRVAPAAVLDHESAPGHGIVVRAEDLAGNPFSKAFVITVENVNEAPVITLSAPPATETDSDRVVSGLSVADEDAGGADVSVGIGVGHGILNLDESGPLAGEVAGNGSASVIVTAPLADLNAVLGAGGLVYQSAIDFVGTETLSVTADDGGASGSGGPQNAAASEDFEVFAEGFHAFQIAHFTAAELADPSVSGAVADPDGDRLPNLGEYGLNGNPRDGRDAGQLVEPVWIGEGDQAYPALRFQRRTLASDPSLEIVVEVATDVVNWHSGSGFTTLHESLPLEPDFDQVTIRSDRSTADERRQVLRVRITQL